MLHAAHREGKLRSRSHEILGALCASVLKLFFHARENLNTEITKSTEKWSAYAR
jgi:hypothetical protein